MSPGTHATHAGGCQTLHVTTDPATRDRGASALEYVGSVALGALIVIGVFSVVGSFGGGMTGILSTSAQCITSGGQQCGGEGSSAAAGAPGDDDGTTPADDGGAPADDEEPPDRRDTQRDARGDRRDTERERVPGGDDGQEGPDGGGPSGIDGDAALPTGVGEPVPGTTTTPPEPPPWEPFDEGAGDHDSEFAGPVDRSAEVAAETAANAMAGAWPDASRNLLHFLANSGDTLEQDVDAMLADVPRMQEEVDVLRGNLTDAALADAQARGADGPLTYPLNTEWAGFYIGKEDSSNWFYALGGIQYNVSGQVTVFPPTEPGGEWTYETTTTVSIRDQYNWDGGKATQIGPFTITDERLAALHRAGLAQEFTATGTSGSQTTSGP